jgi:hypothetical protein
MMLVIVIRLRLVVVVLPLDRTYVGFFIWVFSLQHPPQALHCSACAKVELLASTAKTSTKRFTVLLHI